MCTLHAVIVLCFCCWQGLANRSMSIQDLHVGLFPIPLFISLFLQVQSYARAHVPVYPHTPTRIRSRTHTGNSSKHIDHSRGVSLQSVSTTWRNVWRCTSFLTISVSVVSSCRGTWGCCLHLITARMLPRVCVGTGGGNPSPGRVRRLPVVVPPSSGAWGRLRGVWAEDD